MPEDRRSRLRFLLDAKGQFQGTIAYREDMETALGKLRNLLAKS